MCRDLENIHFVTCVILSSFLFRFFLFVWFGFFCLLFICLGFLLGCLGFDGGSGFVLSFFF